MASSYSDVYDAWKQDPEAFWAKAAADIDWFRPPERVFDPDRGVYGRWFAGGETNTCFNCLDRHVASGRADQTALIYDSPVTGTVEHWTYGGHARRSFALAAVYRGTRRTKGRPDHHLYADDPAGGLCHAGGARASVPYIPSSSAGSRQTSSRRA